MFTNAANVLLTGSKRVATDMAKLEMLASFMSVASEDSEFLAANETAFSFAYEALSRRITALAKKIDAAQVTIGFD